MASMKNESSLPPKLTRTTRFEFPPLIRFAPTPLAHGFVSRTYGVNFVHDEYTRNTTSQLSTVIRYLTIPVSGAHLRKATF